MRKNYIATCMALVTVTATLFAGNPQRAGSAGASELLINPWARSAGWADVNIAGVEGLHSSFVNIAGLYFVEGTEFSFSNTQWLVGSGITVNSGAIASKVSDVGVLTVSLQSFSYGEWEITTTASPEGGAGKISPSSLAIGLGYAQMFTDYIYGGVNIKIYNSTISNLSATGAAIDAGIQYRLGDNKEYKFGITLKNVGPGFSYGGDGFSVTLPVAQGGYSQSYESRSAKFELPTQLSIGVSYDYRIVPDVHKITFAGAFSSNAFEKDHFNFGARYAYKDWFSFQMGYRLFDNRVDGYNSSAIQGLTAGISFDAPLGDRSSVQFDYAYRMTRVFGGIHSVGIGIAID